MRILSSHLEMIHLYAGPVARILAAWSFPNSTSAFESIFLCAAGSQHSKLQRAYYIYLHPGSFRGPYGHTHPENWKQWAWPSHSPAGMIWSECKEIWEEGPREYVLHLWNLLDFGMLSIFVASFTARFMAFLKASEAQLYVDQHVQDDTLHNVSLPPEVAYFTYGESEVAVRMVSLRCSAARWLACLQGVARSLGAPQLVVYNVTAAHFGLLCCQSRHSSPPPKEVLVPAIN